MAWRCCFSLSHALFNQASLHSSAHLVNLSFHVFPSLQIMKCDSVHLNEQNWGQSKADKFIIEAPGMICLVQLFVRVWLICLTHIVFSFFFVKKKDDMIKSWLIVITLIVYDLKFLPLYWCFTWIMESGRLPSHPSTLPAIEIFC